MRIFKEISAKGALIASCCFALGTPAAPETTVICDNTFNLKRTHQLSYQSQSIPNSSKTISTLAALAAELETYEYMTSNSAFASLSAELSNLAANLANIERIEHENSDAIGVTLFHGISQNMHSLNRIESLFGCRSTEFPDSKLKASDLRSGNIQLTYFGFNSNELPELSAGLAFLTTAVFLAILAVGIFLKLGRQEVRRICRTSLLIVNGDQCTVTHIVDINQSGMKVEASQVTTVSEWMDLYFCGYKFEGKIVWRNTYYAGVKFRTKPSRNLCNDVIQKSHKSLEESGLEENAPSCFSIGCHLNCPHHRPTALSEGCSTLSQKRKTAEQTPQPH